MKSALAMGTLAWSVACSSSGSGPGSADAGPVEIGGGSTASGGGTAAGSGDGDPAGAFGGLFAELDDSDSLFTKNTAIGNGANNDDPSKCSAMNNGQNEIGSGGNGGAVYSDGN